MRRRHPDDDTHAVVASMLVQSTLLGEMLENARVGALAVDEGRCVAADAYLCELLGYAREELIGADVSELPIAGFRESGDLDVIAKGGRLLELSYRVVPTTLAGMDILIGLFWVRD